MVPAFLILTVISPGRWESTGGTQEREFGEAMSLAQSGRMNTVGSRGAEL